ncbi:MAG: EAL domain-containing protein [Treponema sp.]|nr:EAL domain-containing protein [Treponema sp.]
MNKQIIKKRKLFSYVSIFVLCVGSLFGAVYRCAKLVEKNYLEQLEQNLEDVAFQISQSLREQIEIRYELLKSVAIRFDIEPEKRLENLYMFEPVTDAFRLVRIGFCDKNGISHATSGFSADLRFREFFKRGMNGETYISDVLQDAMDENHDHVTVMSMPIHNRAGEIDGIAAITYKTEYLSDDISSEIFEGVGATIVISENGIVNISSNESLINIHDNLFNKLFENMKDENISRTEIVNRIIGGNYRERNNYFTLIFGNKEYYYDVEPVNIMGEKHVWYAISLVPKEYFAARFRPTKVNLYRMLMFVLIFGLVSIFLVEVVSMHQRSLTNRMAYVSPLTGGPNTNQFFNILKRNEISDGFMVYMNIENFTNTSLAIGKGRSNKLLKSTWNLLALEERSDDLFCHNQKDSFLLYFGNINEETLEKRLELLRDIIHDEAISEHISWVNAHFGIYKIRKANRLEDASHKAEIAAHDVHPDSKCFAYFDDKKQKRQIELQKLEDHFDEALNAREFEIYFQPKYNSAEKRLTGCEALVRWNYKGKKMVSPGEFIPMLERTGKIVKLDEYIFERVCEYQSNWKKSGLKIVPVSVNISKATLFLDNIEEYYCSILERHDLTTREIQLEVTETLVSTSGSMANLLNRFRDRGFKILMDDFGTGYTALSTLNLQCFDTLKMDKSLIDGIENDFGQDLLAGVIEMTKKLGYYITAEGVETEEQFLFLKALECDDIQGFLFSKPLPANEFALRIETPIHPAA